MDPDVQEAIRRLYNTDTSEDALEVTVWFDDDDSEALPDAVLAGDDLGPPDLPAC